MEKKIEELYRVDKKSPVPMYFQIKQEILKSIKSGIYKTGEQLPTELDFCEALSISRPTIRQALQELINEGYITRHKAKGTFVSKPKVDGFFFNKLTSYNEEMKLLGLEPSTNVIIQEVVHPNEEIQNALQLDAPSKVLHLARLRFANEDPMVYVHTYIPCHHFPEIEKEDFSNQTTSLYELMKHKYDMPIAYVDRTIEAIITTSDVCTLLQIEEAQPIYAITTTAYNEQDIPIEYSIAKYRGDRNKFTIRLVQK